MRGLTTSAESGKHRSISRNCSLMRALVFLLGTGGCRRHGNCTSASSRSSGSNSTARRRPERRPTTSIACLPQESVNGRRRRPAAAVTRGAAAPTAATVVAGWSPAPARMAAESPDVAGIRAADGRQSATAMKPVRASVGRRNIVVQRSPFCFTRCQSFQASGSQLTRTFHRVLQMQRGVNSVNI